MPIIRVKTRIEVLSRLVEETVGYGDDLQSILQTFSKEMNSWRQEACLRLGGLSEVSDAAIGESSIPNRTGSGVAEVSGSSQRDI